MSVSELAMRVEADTAGRTVAAAVRGLAGVSHSIAKGLVDQGMVRVNGRVVRNPAHRVAAGDRIEARYDAHTRYHAKPGRRLIGRTHGFNIVLEDDDLIVVDKQAGLITVPAPSHPDDSLADRLVAMYGSRGFKSPRLWVVHRIDRYTSGLVLFARTPAAALSLMEQFEKRKPRREYLAICEGLPVKAQGRLESWLEENPKSLKVAETRDRKTGQHALLRYDVEERLSGHALVRVTLETGRRNQIRVQFAGIGHPLVGDRTYGRPSDHIARVALHAARLGFEHPGTGRPVRVECPMPEDMAKLLRRLRASAPAP